MAIDVSSDIAGALSQRFQASIARQYNRITVLAAALPTEGAVQGNAKNVAWDVVLGDSYDGFGQTANAYNEATAMASGEFTTDTIAGATLPWGLYRNGFSVSDQEFDEAFVSGGSAVEASVKLLEERILSATSALASQENQDLWNGTGSAVSGLYSGAPNIIGLFGGALAASGTYAGVSVADYPSWGSNVLANGGVGRPLTFDLMAQLETEIYNACSEKPNLIVCSSNVWRKYNALFEPLRRFNDRTKMYDTSADELEWRGIRIIRDKDAPESASNGTGCMVFLNTEHIKKVYLPPSQASRADVWKVQDSELAGFNGDSMRSGMSVPVRVIPLSRNGDYMQFMVKSTVQLKVTRRNALGVIQDISIT
jgi:hypothetical protein